MKYPEATFLEVIFSKNGVLKIIFNRPKKKNALNYEMKQKFPEILLKAAKDQNVKVVAVSGRGDYFTSGNDFSSTDKELDGIPPEEAAEMGFKSFQHFIKTLIEFPKPLIAILNGPAVGVGVTMLSHFDYVIASSLATFHTPFSSLGVNAEGCSSFYFPQMMGMNKASEMLIFGRKISALEALERNLVSVVLPYDMMQSAWDKVDEIASLPLQSMMATKRLVKSNKLITHLNKVNEAECNELRVRTQSEEFFDAIQRRFLKRAKL